MSEYIDRQAASDALARLCKRVCQYSEKQRQYMCGACPLGDAFTVIEDDLPAADVRPVRRGKWSIVYDDFMKSHYDTCSCCGKEYFGANGFNFCPNCGCVMEDT